MALALSSLETQRLGSVLRTLLSPLAHQNGESWRTEVARRLCDLVKADQAVFVLEEAERVDMYAAQMDAEVIRAYRSHFAALDLGAARLRTSEIEVWSRRSLWESGVLARSEYYNDFARPHRLHDAVGAAIRVRELGAQARAALFHHRPVPSAAVTERQTALLSLALPALKAGINAHLRWNSARRRLTQVIDEVGHPLAICNASGRILHQNPAMTQVAAQIGPSGARVRESLTQVARATATAARAPVAPNWWSAYEALMRGAQRGLHATIAEFPESERGGSDHFVLVSLPAPRTEPEREPAPAAGAEQLHGRFQLTERETQVAQLLVWRRSNAEIARALSISAHTARHHTENVLRKLGVHSRDAVAERLQRAGGGQPPQYFAPTPSLENTR